MKKHGNDELQQASLMKPTSIAMVEGVFADSNWTYCSDFVLALYLCANC